MQRLLNLGCGQRFHPEWTNVDFVSSGKDVIAHNLLKGIPFSDNEFDVVYHSHVLEHFSKKEGREFMRECFRVLKRGGLIRVAVPDLEEIVRNYLKSFEGALNGDQESMLNYEWMMLELYDQTVRNRSGGEMAEYFFKDEIENEKFVFSRVGEEGRNIRKNFLDKQKGENPVTSYVYRPASLMKRLINPNFYINKIRRVVFKNEFKEMETNRKFYEIGKFRLGGEIHQWMYDKYSLGKLLHEIGFSNSKVKTAFESSISKWNDYQLESKNGIVFKPDSLFMEAQKPL